MPESIKDEPRLGGKATFLVLVMLLIVAGLLVKLIFDPELDADRSVGLFLAVGGTLNILLHVNRKLALWLDNTWSWRVNERHSVLWRTVGLQGMRMFNIGLGVLLVIAGLILYVKPLRL